jgi:hypothetical protein
MSEMAMNGVTGTAGASTLQSWMGAREAALAERLCPKLLKKAAQSDREHVKGWLTVAGQKGISGCVAGKVCGMLQEEAVGVITGVWGKYAELKRCARETLSDPGEPAVVGLAEHSFSYGFAPSVTVKLDGVKVAEIPFLIGVTCTLTSLKLELVDGCVRRVLVGSCEGKGTIRCADTVIWERPLMHVDLPGEMRLRKPIRLAGTAHEERT